MKTFLKIVCLVAYLWGGAFGLLSFFPGHLARGSYDSREWTEAWECRCDTCCETLDRLEAEALILDQKEGAQP